VVVHVPGDAAQQDFILELELGVLAKTLQPVVLPAARVEELATELERGIARAVLDANGHPPREHHDLRC